MSGKECTGCEEAYSKRFYTRIKNIYSALTAPSQPPVLRLDLVQKNLQARLQQCLEGQECPETQNQPQ